MRAFIALISAAVCVTGCAAVSEMTGSTVLATDASKAPFFEAAKTRVAGHALPDQSNMADAPGKLRGATSSARSYSGSPDRISLKSIYDKQGLVHAPGARKYVQSILDRILKHWPYETGRLGIFFVSDDSFEAQATAAGDILLSVGMLVQLESEDELAAILAHEISHILLNHHERAKQVAENKQLLNAAASATVTYLMFSNTDWVKTGQNSYQGTVNTGNWLNQSLQAGGACLAATYFIDKLIDPGWNRQQEDEADLLGLDLMIKAGYNPNAALQVMRRHIDYEGPHKSSVQRRQEAGEYDKMMNDAVSQNGISGVFTGAARTLAAGVIDTLSDVDDYISQKHRMSVDRLTSMQTYLDLHYSMRERIPLSESPFNAAIKSGTTRRIFENFRAARAAQKALEANDLETAEKLARQSIQAPTSDAVQPRLTMYSIQTMKGEHDAAFQNLLKVKDLDGAPPQLFHLLANGYAKQGKTKLAQQMAQRATDRAHSVYDNKDAAQKTLFDKLFKPSNDDLFAVEGYCETLKGFVSGTAATVSGRQL